mmetsp:Transcript_110961/g.312841  ORF Transcript_110961/g.312841 Transcript_110961/m.312841 type:complete len:227 (+) Transcript_110961:395-1075(+)
MISNFYELQNTISVASPGVSGERYLCTKILPAALGIQVPREPSTHAVPLRTDDPAVVVLHVPLCRKQLMWGSNAGAIHRSFKGFSVIRIDSLAQRLQLVELDRHEDWRNGRRSWFHVRAPPNGHFASGTWPQENIVKGADHVGDHVVATQSFATAIALVAEMERLWHQRWETRVSLVVVLHQVNLQTLARRLQPFPRQRNLLPPMRGKVVALFVLDVNLHGAFARF